MSKKKRKPSRGVRASLMSRWKSEVFPAFMLVYGQAPELLRLSRHDEYWAQHQALDRFRRAITCFYHHAYLREYDVHGNIVQQHLYRFAEEYIEWARTSKEESYGDQPRQV